MFQKPAGSGWWEVGAAVDPSGVMARAEVGVRINENIGAFAQANVRSQNDYNAVIGIGGRW